LEEREVYAKLKQIHRKN